MAWAPLLQTCCKHAAKTKQTNKKTPQPNYHCLASFFILRSLFPKRLGQSGVNLVNWVLATANKHYININLYINPVHCSKRIFNNRTEVNLTLCYLLWTNNPISGGTGRTSCVSKGSARLRLKRSDGSRVALRLQSRALICTELHSLMDPWQGLATPRFSQQK